MKGAIRIGFDEKEPGVKSWRGRGRAGAELTERWWFGGEYGDGGEYDDGGDFDGNDGDDDGDDDDDDDDGGDDDDSDGDGENEIYLWVWGARHLTSDCAGSSKKTENCHRFIIILDKDHSIRFAISTSVSVTPNTKMRILNITPEVEMSVRERILIEKSSEVVQLGTGVLNDHTHLGGIIIIITTPFWEGVLIIIMGMKSDLGSMLESEREKRRLPMKKLSMSSPNSNQSGREIKITQKVPM